MRKVSGFKSNAAAVAAAILLAACVTPAPAPRVTLDAKTGISLTVVDEPLVLARDRRDVAAQARDYLTLVAAEINEAGHRRLILVSHQWSTIDSRTADVHPSPNAELLLVADGRDLHFTPLPATFGVEYANKRALHAPEASNAVTTFYDSDTETLSYLATSRIISASIPNSFPLAFSLWKDGRPALTRLLDALQDQR